MVPRALSGTASGLVMSIGYLGAIIGPLVAGYILYVTDNFNIIFILLIVASILTSLVSLALRERTKVLPSS